jgi:hypothetical protein
VFSIDYLGILNRAEEGILGRDCCANKETKKAALKT